MLDAFMSRYLICADSVEQFVFLADGETVCVYPCSVDAFEGSMEVFLGVLAALN
jgi:hypothetical protein